MTKKVKKILLVSILLIIYIYVFAIEKIPDKVVIFEGDNIALNNRLGLKISLDSGTIETVANGSQISAVTQKSGKSTLEVSLFNKIKVKDVEVDILPKTTVIPLGNMAGLKLYTNGVLVVGMSEIKGIDSKNYKPYENTGIEEGDRIMQINQVPISTTEELIKNVNNSNGNSVKVEYVHNNETKECSINPVQTGKNQYKLGLWVRDSAAGVGTVTFYEAGTKKFGALGHGITDVDTEELINIASGEFVTTRVLDIAKGEKGTPGKILGTIENQKSIGKIYKNSKFGIYGTVDEPTSLGIDTSKEMQVASRDEIEVGKATILCSLDNQRPKEYDIEIEKIFKDNNHDNKSMQIKVTDQRLLEKTGGIIQGMSGSPVIQNGKFVGAVTHVLVNNPEKGYAVFGDIMLKQLKET